MVQKLTQMVGKNVKLYDMVLQFLRTLFLRTRNVHYCTLRAELLMSLHDLDVSDICSVDPCHKVAPRPWPGPVPLPSGLSLASVSPPHGWGGPGTWALTAHPPGCLVCACSSISVHSAGDWVIHGHTRSPARSIIPLLQPARPRSPSGFFSIFLWALQDLLTPPSSPPPLSTPDPLGLLSASAMLQDQAFSQPLSPPQTLCGVTL